jgi:hypothetical protein
MGLMAFAVAKNIHWDGPSAVDEVGRDGEEDGPKDGRRKKRGKFVGKTNREG